MMKRITPLITGGLISLGAMLGAVSPASASVPPPEQHTYRVDSSTYLTSTRTVVEDDVYRDETFVGDVLFLADDAANHLGQHRQVVSIRQAPGVDIHVRLDVGSRVLDFHASAAGHGFDHTFYYPVRKFRVTPNTWGPGWGRPPIKF